MAGWELKANDIVYVGIEVMGDFVERGLSTLRKDIIIISGSFHFGLGAHLPLATKILDHHHVVALLIHNPPRQLKHNKKLHGFPYGLRDEKSYAVAYDAHPPLQPRDFVFHSYISKQNNPKARESIESGPKLLVAEYLQEMARHQYVLSPNGDRPDCFRNYEAIGLGTVPIRQEAPKYLTGWMHDAVFNIPTELWNNNSALKERLPPYRGTNRQFVLFDYWQKRVEALRDAHINKTLHHMRNASVA